MEFKNIFTFTRVAELGSFTAASRELGYTQSAVSIQIKQLEEELGVPLFDRVGKSISLTTKGQEFLIYANEILSIILKAKNMISSSETCHGSLRIGMLESLFIWRFCDLLPLFHSIMPLVNITINLSTGTNLYQKLRQNEIDIAYLLGKKLFVKGCVHTYVNRERIVFVTCPENPIACKKSIPIGEIFRQPLILVESWSVYRIALDELVAELGIEYTPLLEIDNTTGILKLIKNGMGVSFLPKYIVNESVRKNELVELDVKGCDVQLWSQVVYHKNKWVTPQMELFMKLIGEKEEI
ncbi:LysR family transcriptional regulator [Acetomicrobium mobile]|uniref:LysR family transcriptional regulator n=1 Tax=Acetomicrobium mobile TaxID=97477 RepID=UPI0026E93D74|nr:LysR family transcriptional regulator [Acetomicrobium mobile]